MENENKNAIIEAKAGNDEDTNCTEETSMTMLDVLEEEKELEEEYAAVLGASDEKCCTYNQGPVIRQALYSCLTCCPEFRQSLENCAGICLACSYQCHENHELVELYTKRNFRCDCPTERMGNNNRCRLNANIQQPEKRNECNTYNQNFQGLYCNCHRPYPDPDKPQNTEEVMLQCSICEDWFHLNHLNNVPSNANQLMEEYSEMICDKCMEANTFLYSYRKFSLNEIKKNNKPSNVIVDIMSKDGIDGDASGTSKDNDNKLYSDLDKSISDIMNIGELASSKSTDNSGMIADGEPAIKKQKLEIIGEENSEKQENQQCQRPKCDGITNEKGPTFWANDWRSKLCRCAECLNMYKNAKVDYLLNEDDTTTSYEERGKKKVANESTPYEKGIQALASFNRVQQIDAITEYNRMKDRLLEYLQSFAVNKKVVTEEDINRFFREMRNERDDKSANQSSYFCR